MRVGEAEELYREEHKFNTCKCRMLHLRKNNSMHLITLGRGGGVCVMRMSVCLEDFYIAVAQMSKLA